MSLIHFSAFLAYRMMPMHLPVPAQLLMQLPVPAQPPMQLPVPAQPPMQLPVPAQPSSLYRVGLTGYLKLPVLR
jgi:hypothetical protein